jgi:hypothetical protein
MEGGRNEGTKERRNEGREGGLEVGGEGGEWRASYVPWCRKHEAVVWYLGVRRYVIWFWFDRR